MSLANSHLHEALALFGRELFFAPLGLAGELNWHEGIGGNEAALGGPVEQGASLVAVALLLLL